ncbi:MAG: nitrite/sulfite reductase [Deltaproteobacteria bacterium]|nr:nitrite/sulfite reductase [Deltaproteobacteria bacterium]
MTFRVAGERPAVLAEIEELSSQIERYRRGLVPEHVFVERRLRHGIYGQRQDGVHMMRSKLPLGLISPAQLAAFADIAETYGSGVAHLTTRQDIQVHFVRLPSTPGLLRDLDAADMSAREACGNVVRNVTAAANSGVVSEPFDVTPHALRLARFAMRHPDGQALGRKFKISFASVNDPLWNLARIHDLGFTARRRDGVDGFEVRAGGGLGAVPMEAQVLHDFVPADEIASLTQAVLRAFARHGEKKNRARARLKFLLADWGIERLRAEVAALTEPVATEPLPPVADAPLFPPGTSTAHGPDLLAQRQPGYVAVKVRVPRGDLTPAQLRGLATLLAREVGDTTRITPEQGLLVRFVSTDRLRAVREGLAALGLGDSGAHGLADPVTCPGADTCKLGITRPRAVATAMGSALDALAVDEKLSRLRVHISGCPNGCAQHAIADIGFYGAARTVNGVVVPHYLVILGGEAGGLAFGGAVAKVPAARGGEAVRVLAEAFRLSNAASFAEFVRASGRPALKALLEPLQELPALEADPAAYREAGSDEPFRVVRGVGECAGEVVDGADFLLSDADAAVEEAHARPERAIVATERAFRLAARALLAVDHAEPRADAEVLAAFKSRFYEAGRIFEGVGYYYLHAATEADPTGDRLRRRVAEAELFVQEAHGIVGRIRAPAPQPRHAAPEAT